MPYHRQELIERIDALDFASLPTNEQAFVNEVDQHIRMRMPIGQGTLDQLETILRKAGV